MTRFIVRQKASTLVVWRHAMKVLQITGRVVTVICTLSVNWLMYMTRCDVWKWSVNIQAYINHTKTYVVIAQFHVLSYTLLLYQSTSYFYILLQSAVILLRSCTWFFIEPNSLFDSSLNLAIMATSVPSERLWSTTLKLWSLKRRSRSAKLQIPKEEH